MLRRRSIVTPNTSPRFARVHSLIPAPRLLNRGALELQQPTSGSARGSKTTTQAPDVAQGAAPFLPHLVEGIAAAVSRGHNGSATLTLAPEELGHVRLSFQPDMQTPDRLVVMLSFDRPETMDLFRRHADQLAEALRTAGYAGVQIGFGGTGTDGARQQTGQTWAADLVADDQIPVAEGLLPPVPRHLASHAALDLRL